MMTRAQATALIAGGALSALAMPVRAQTPTTVNIAVQPVENAMEVYYAKDTGRFAAAGLDADIQIVQSVGAIVAAVVSGSVDIGYGTIDVLAAVHAKNIPIAVIAPASEYLSPATERISALVVGAASPIRQAKDLNGKVVSSAGLKSLGETNIRAWVDKNGGDSSSIKFVEIPFPAVSAALESGRIDAGFLPEPFLSKAPVSSRVLVYGFDAVADHFILSAFFTTTQYAKDHPDLVTHFANTIRETAGWADKNPAATGTIVAKYAKLDPTVVAAMARSRYAEALTPALMQPLIDASAKYNGFSAFPAKDLIW